MSDQVLKIYTDGACSGNPGPGGWGVVMIWGEIIREMNGFERETTNNRMELQAAIEGLKAVKKAVPVEMYTDSQYVKNGITVWISAWQASGWKNGKVKNRDLWEELLNLTRSHKVTWYWVKGHANDKYNNIADRLATDAIKDNRS